MAEVICEQEKQSLNVTVCSFDSQITKLPNINIWASEVQAGLWLQINRNFLKLLRHSECRPDQKENVSISPNMFDQFFN